MNGLMKKNSIDWEMQSDFMNLISNRNPKFPEIESNYPEMQIDKYEWKIPFKEGGKGDDYEITFRVGTLNCGEIFFEKYTKCTSTDKSPDNFIINKLKNIVIESVKKSWKNKNC